MAEIINSYTAKWSSKPTKEQQFYLMHYSYDNTWDIIPKSFAKNVNGSTCTVFYKMNKGIHLQSSFKGTNEFIGSEEECLQKAKELHPVCFTRPTIYDVGSVRMSAQ